MKNSLRSVVEEGKIRIKDNYIESFEYINHYVYVVFLVLCIHKYLG